MESSGGSGIRGYVRLPESDWDRRQVDEAVCETRGPRGRLEGVCRLLRRCRLVSELSLTQFFAVNCAGESKIR